ncbi:uncharacterized protein MONBRDRAFT_29810 [Monosiga brevicollis MX1]|uniref:Diacylglycerol kinase n=1 Tax=Monosiga brevicollis TaxID=81824 RepID=A9VC68_MONBE|nr:uncharacterized protein MONBRDRAFT_29810 [Monosiga brevicollis MX1]EDQ84808.1 predicted protein [Monosiga brevicollis MX1]|eukprot:XP_001750309.1 hypothetical protein [Monosiga brevicollis MX1]
MVCKIHSISCVLIFSLCLSLSLSLGVALGATFYGLNTSFKCEKLKAVSTTTRQTDLHRGLGLKDRHQTSTVPSCCARVRAGHCALLLHPPAGSAEPECTTMADRPVSPRSRRRKARNSAAQESELSMFADEAASSSGTPVPLDEKKPLHDWDSTSKHHWISGVFDKSKVCFRCTRPLGVKALSLQARAYRCSLCKRYIHLDCLKNQFDVWGTCDLGEFAPITLGPEEICLQPLLSDVVKPGVAGVCLTADDIDMITSSGHSGLRKASLDANLQHRASTGYLFERTSPMGRGSDFELGRRVSPIRSRQESDGSLTAPDDEDAVFAGFNVNRLSDSQQQEFRASMRRASARKATAHRRAHMQAARALEAADRADYQFHIQPRPETFPLLVLVNPKSGGNQGAKLLHSFLYYLNPRQVYNLMATDPDTGKVQGPGPALDRFKNVPNLRILVCGGDGTVGWVLAELDARGMDKDKIGVGTIPLGTGNDLARFLKMGGGYEGESTKKLLHWIMGSLVMQLDRWSLTYRLRDPAPTAGLSDIPVAVELPLIVVNNYFSFGSDAFATLSFHLARERDPAKFNSRIHNKAYYGFQGAKDIFRHRYKDLCETLELEFDGRDVTQTVRRQAFEAIAFLNIASYAAGTRPWGTKNAVDGFDAPSSEDQKLEVVGFQSALALAKGVMRIGHAARLAQCRSAKITFHVETPVQVDGEPVMLAPGEVVISFKNQATLLCRPKGRFRRDFQEGSRPAAFPLTNAVEAEVAEDRRRESDEEDDDMDSDGDTEQVVAVAGAASPSLIVRDVEAAEAAAESDNMSGLADNAAMAEVEALMEGEIETHRHQPDHLLPPEPAHRVILPVFLV